MRAEAGFTIAGRQGAAAPAAAAVARRGFTLLELLIAISLIAILSGISAPFVLHESPAARTAGAAETLAQAMRLARFRAISTNRDVYLHVEPGGADDFYTAYVNLGNPGDVPTGTAEEIAATGIEFLDEAGDRRGTRLPSDVRFDAGSATSAPEGGTAVKSGLDLPANPLVFEPRGTVRWPQGSSSSTGTLYVRHAEDADVVRAVTVSRSGLVRAWRLDGKKWR